MTQPDDSRVDDLRKQLRALGYLDAGVDRFVLAPARSARRPAAIAALSSLRVGLLAAALLGPVAAIGIRARLPGLITGTTDAIVIALYLAVLFGVAATASSFVASMFVATLGGVAAATRARVISRAAGTIVAISCLAYLTIWWQRANTEVWSSPAWTGGALLIAVVISILLGHAVAITTVAVIAARHPMHTAAVPRRSASRLVLATGVVAFAGAAGLLVLATPHDVDEVDRPHLAVVSPGVKVRVIAIDGFDPAVYESLRVQGRVRALASVLEAATSIGAADVLDPARAWATIATGQSPEVHGLHSLETRRVAGIEGSVSSGDEEGGVGRAIRGATDLLRLTRPAIASGDELRVKPFWEVASEAGLRTVVVNWWATWPAAGSGPVAPVILSDRATLRLERGGELDAEIAPKEAYEKLRSAWPQIKDRAALAGARVLRNADPAISSVIRRSAELDALQILMLNHVEEPATTDLVTVYLPGLDIAQHTLLGAGERASPSTLAARLDAVRAYYDYVSDLVAGLVADLRLDHELILIVTQPGRLPSASQGLIAAVGRMSAPGSKEEARPIDVAPTILYALGLPISSELAGRPLLALLEPAIVQKFPVREVPTYGPRRARSAVRHGQALDEEMVERLRSLGYVR